MNAYDPGDGLLSVSKEVDNKYGQWVKYQDVKEVFDTLETYLEECRIDNEDRWITREKLRELFFKIKA